MNHGAKPVICTTVSKIPAGMTEDCNRLIENIIQKGCIKPYDGFSIWCSPARFVKMSNGSPRLVVNFKGLNAPGNNLGYPFSSAADIQSLIESGSKMFATFRLTDA